MLVERDVATTRSPTHASGPTAGDRSTVKTCGLVGTKLFQQSIWRIQQGAGRRQAAGMRRGDTPPTIVVTLRVITLDKVERPLPFGIVTQLQRQIVDTRSGI